MELPSQCGGDTVLKCVKWSSHAGLSCRAARSDATGAAAGVPGGVAGRRGPPGEATSDLGPEPSGDRRSPGPTLWAEAADRREGSQRQLCECLEGEAREAVEEQALDPRTRPSGPGRGRRRTRRRTGAGRGPRPGGRRHHRAAGPSGAREGARGGGPGPRPKMAGLRAYLGI